MADPTTRADCAQHIRQGRLRYAGRVTVPQPSPVPRCWPAALIAAPGLVLLALMWVVFLSLASGGTAVFLRGLTATQAALVLGCAVLIRPRRDRRLLRPGLLPAVIWVLCTVDATLLAASGLY